MALSYNMSPLTHLSQNWSKSWPKLAKAQGLVVATLPKYRENPKRARHSENVEGDIFVGKYATQISCALRLTHWGNRLLRYIKFCGLWNSLWVSGGTLKNFFGTEPCSFEDDDSAKWLLKFCAWIFSLSSPSFEYSLGNGCFQFKSHSLLSPFPPQNHGFDIKVNHQRIQTTHSHTSCCHHCNYCHIAMLHFVWFQH